LSRSKLALFGAAATTVILAMQISEANAADAAATAQASSSVTVGELVVTAQKRQENIQSVPMSITAASGDTLTKLGVVDTSQLIKIVPGFNYTPGVYGTPVYTLRGVGFQDTSLSDSPTVSVYVDEAPLPYSAMTKGATLDLQRVEVLKGPQGTLFGENATGGAINYIANKPTDTFKAGFDASYGRFNTFDGQGFVSGPITNTLDFRIAGRVIESGPWQQTYAPAPAGRLGDQNFLDLRTSLLWKPTDRFRALLTISTWADKGDPQAAQLVQIENLNKLTPLPPYLQNFPASPHNARDAGWQSCINTSGNTYPPPANSASTSCTPPHNNNAFFGANLRLDYDLGNDLTVTSLTSVGNFNRYSAIPGDGTPYQDYESIQKGLLRNVYQELRLSGKIAGKGSWIVGANYEYDDTYDSFLQSYGDSSSRTVFGIPLGPTNPVDAQHTNTYAVYGNGEYPITDHLTIQGGIRYTQENKSFDGCEINADSGQYSGQISQILQEIYQGANGTPGQTIIPAYGQCASLGPASNNFIPSLIHEVLNQNNLSWRTGLKWAFDRDAMVYFNVSRGYKGGAFPTLSQSTATQSNPVVQESLLAYEGGFKATTLHHTLQLNAAGFYYDYTNKQILGDILDPTFGALPSLVNVPKSHVIGFEFSGGWTPIEGLTFTPSVSYQHTQIDTCSPTIVTCQLLLATDGSVISPAGHFHNYNYQANPQDFNGEAFPLAPEWQADIDAEYDWKLGNGLGAFVGANVNYQGQTNSGFGEFAILNVPAYTLLDLRAGLEKDAWRIQIWGRNVTNKYYWTIAAHVNDADLRYAGMPGTYGVTINYRFH
jgi:iron complex outermembrane receptor protein